MTARPLISFRVWQIPFGVLIIALCAIVSAEPEIHRCPQADGTVAFQETPCAEPAVETPDTEDEPSAASDDFFDFVNPYDQPTADTMTESIDEPSSQNAPALPPPVSQDRSECEKITRDAIDAVDLEMRRGYSAEEGERYKAELMTLTRQLRACKSL